MWICSSKPIFWYQNQVFVTLRDDFMSQNRWKFGTIFIKMWQGRYILSFLPPKTCFKWCNYVLFLFYSMRQVFCYLIHACSTLRWGVMNFQKWSLANLAKSWNPGSNSWFCLPRSRNFIREGLFCYQSKAVMGGSSWNIN